MVLRDSITNARKFFQKSIGNFKSLFSNNGTYQKLPKTPNNTSINNHHHLPNPNNIKPSSSSIHKEFQPKPKNYVIKTRAFTMQPRRGDKDETLFSKPKVDLVIQKLKEMEKMMIDDIVRDEEHLSDVREFLYCYSRLRYTAYIDVVDHFFMEVYSDFFCLQPLERTRVAVSSRHPTVATNTDGKVRDDH